MMFGFDHLLKEKNHKMIFTSKLVKWQEYQAFSFSVTFWLVATQPEGSLYRNKTGSDTLAT